LCSLGHEQYWVVGAGKGVIGFPMISTWRRGGVFSYQERGLGWLEGGGFAVSSLDVLGR